MIYVNGDPINTTMFPDNTSQVWKLPIKTYHKHVSVVWEYAYEAEIMQLAQLKELLNVYNLSADLDIKYLPYARQDKNIDNNSTFALRVFANILNGMKWNTVAILDPHSSLASDLIFNTYAYWPHRELEKAYNNCAADFVCYPDNGATVKYKELYDYEYMWASKIRDQATGNIINLDLISEQSLINKTVLIVDDICDGGMTFIMLAKKLYEAGVKEVHLFVTHGIFSKGLQPLLDAGILTIHTAKGRVTKSSFQKGI